MDSSVSPKDEIWFLRVCHHISTGLKHYGQNTEFAPSVEVVGSRGHSAVKGEVSYEEEFYLRNKWDSAVSETILTSSVFAWWLDFMAAACYHDPGGLRKTYCSYRNPSGAFCLLSLSKRVTLEVCFLVVGWTRSGSIQVFWHRPCFRWVYRIRRFSPLSLFFFCPTVWACAVQNRCLMYGLRWGIV